MNRTANDATKPRSSERSPSPTVLSTRSSSRHLILAVLVAAALRVAFVIWAYRHGVIIDSEGAEYARLAQNLASGHGYRGIFDNGVQLNFAPLFPLFIAIFSTLLPSAELAARLINVVLGAMLVVPLFKLAERIYDRKVAWVVTVLGVFHPLLIARSGSTYSEGPYLTLLLSGAYYFILWIEEQRARASALAGMFLGLAYLVRPEAFLEVAGLTGVGLVWAIFAKNRRTVLIGVLSLLGIFGLLASPYIAFLSVNSGQFRIEGKGSLVYAWGQRMDSGMSYQEAMTRIGNDLSSEGIFMMPNYEALHAASYTPYDLIKYVLRGAPQNLRTIFYENVNSQSEGAPVLFLLVFMGWMRSAWNRQRVVNEVILFTTCLMMVLSLLTLRGDYSARFFYSLMGPLLLWAGKGARELHCWCCETLASLPVPENIPRLTARAVQWIFVLSMMAMSLKGVQREGEFLDASRTEGKLAGEWLAKYSSGPKWVMDESLIPAYYAGAALMYLPFATSDVALRYISEKKPDFIVLLEYRKRSRPYLAQWFDDGIPDQRAELIYDQVVPHREGVKIYRWKATQSPPGNT